MLPIIGSPVTPDEIAGALRHARDRACFERFAAALAEKTGLPHVSLAGSGIAAYYRLLVALKERYGKREVILPAYTAGSLVVAIRKAGLTPVLCDISLGDFNADVYELARAITDETLAVTCVHMFGIGMDGVDRLRAMLPPATVLIEDCCQSMGSTIHGRAAGTFGDIAFYSFNRGKNLPLSGGGCVATGSRLLAGVLSGAFASAGDGEGVASGVADACRSAAFAAAANPFVYGALFPLIARFKETAPPEDIADGQLSRFRASLGVALLKRSDVLFAARRETGAALLHGLKDVRGLMVPVVPVDNHPVFNRFPVVFDDASRRTEAEKRLWRRGIETSRMYIRPLHHMFDLGYPQTAFPHANYIGQRLLTLPAHPGVTRAHIDLIVDTIRATLRN